ncbi:CbiX/SirB N-terminal domain-containing protein [Streptomyces sp. NPDC033754]|uniref:CbiX/SirB N-terminal domain-containing protein n=1 Tax=unclassified Streptomyces TaxID=2593676 RepID=UPI0033D7A0D7
MATLLPVPVTVAYCSASAPRPAEAVARLHAQGFRRVAVAAHLPAPGRFTRALAEIPDTWAVGEPLAGHPRLAGLVVARYAGACAGTRAGETVRAA